MVPEAGDESNPKSPLLAAWGDSKKGSLAASEIANHPDIEQLFDTLAEWNDYLENHVPYFQKPQEPEL